MRIKRILIPVILFCSSICVGQIMVVSQNKVLFENVKEYHELGEKYWHPVFDKLVDEGKLDEVGTLGHYWGDEWNVVGSIIRPRTLHHLKKPGRKATIPGKITPQNRSGIK